MQIDIDIDKIEAAAAAADAVAPVGWEGDHERQDDAPGRYHEFFVIDGHGCRIFGTENCDAEFGEICTEYGEDDSYSWNEPSRRVIEFAVCAQPRVVLALIARLRKAEAEADRWRETATAAFADRERLLDVLAVAEHMEWQTIETAPTDGSLVLVWAAPYEGLPCFVTPARYQPNVGWCVDELRGATHWRPLPAGPDNKEGKA